MPAPTVSAFTSTTMTLTWNAANYATSYTLYYTYPGQVEASETATSGRVFTGLTPDASYSFRITGTNNAGTSTHSASVT